MGRPCNCKNNNMHEDLKYAGFVAPDHFSSIHLPLTLTIWGQLISTASLFVKLNVQAYPFHYPVMKRFLYLFPINILLEWAIVSPHQPPSDHQMVVQHSMEHNRPHSLHCLVSGSWRWISCLHPPGPPPTNSKCPWKANRVGHFTGGVGNSCQMDAVLE